MKSKFEYHIESRVLFSHGPLYLVNNLHGNWGLERVGIRGRRLGEDLSG